MRLCQLFSVEFWRGGFRQVVGGGGYAAGWGGVGGLFGWLSEGSFWSLFTLLLYIVERLAVSHTLAVFPSLSHTFGPVSYIFVFTLIIHAMLLVVSGFRIMMLVVCAHDERAMVFRGFEPAPCLGFQESTAPGGGSGSRASTRTMMWRSETGRDNVTERYAPCTKLG